MQSPLERLRYHVTGAIERGEAVAIVEQPTPQCEAERIARQHNPATGLDYVSAGAVRKR